MLTPRFALTQDENHVYITIHAPYTNIKETEIDVDGKNFLFVSTPYFLRLELPGKIVENERSKGSYCVSGDFQLIFDKDSPGEHFNNLDMITSLLAPRNIPENPTLIQDLEESGIIFVEGDDTTVEQTSKQFTYGFANKLSTEFKDISKEFSQVFELLGPENVCHKERHILRMKYECEKFSPDHYLADLYDIELLEPYMQFEAPWQNKDFNKNADFSEEEIGVLKELPNKEYMLSKSEYQQVLHGLVDILFGYCYDKRTTLNESTVESSWTINKLSSTLCWFCVFCDTKQGLIACYRRALCYPIFRNFDLCNKIKNDVVTLLRIGKKLVIKTMIEIHQMFNKSYDGRYILNQLYIKDYLVFLQKCRNEDLDELCNNIANTEITKHDLDLELNEYEELAILESQEHTIENSLTNKISSMSLLPGLRTDGDIDNSSESSDTSDESTSDYSTEELDSDDDLESNE